MTWIPNAKPAQDKGGFVLIEVEFVDDQNPQRVVSSQFTLKSKADFDAFPEIVGKRRDEIAAFYAAVDGFQPGPVVIPQPKEPSQDELDKEAFITARKFYLLKVREFADAKLTGTTQEEVDAAYAAIKPLWKPEYGEFL